MESRRIKCSRYSVQYGCGMLCQDTNAGGRKPWVIQSSNDFPHMSDKHYFKMSLCGFSLNNREKFFLKRWGMQRFTCHKCFEHTCFNCTSGESTEDGGGHYVV
mmetsp:Transcript_38/g.55  ORF Transcript_38/g.55 Transcript_38/m.55 type:complete len:103 (-) Transcript_38:1752-2060(-)